MLKPHLRPAAIVACLLLAGAPPAAAQEKSLRTQISDAVIAAHEYERSMASAREGEAEIAQLRDEAVKWDELGAFVTRVAPLCPRVKKPRDLRGSVPEDQFWLAALVCRTWKAKL